MYSSVLVPVSFETDRDSAGALGVAKSLCEETGQVTLLHVVEQRPDYATHYLPEKYQEKQMVEIQESLDGMAEPLENAKAVIVEGHSARTILDYAEAQGADCIVIASHRPGMQDFLLGSTATHVVRHANCAVHVLR